MTLRIAAALAIALAAPATAQRTDARAMCERLYVGTSGAEPGQGIGTAWLNTTTGQLSGLRLVAEAPRPTWLLVDAKTDRLYAVADPRTATAGAQVLAYAIDRASGDLRPIGAVASGGQGPTHLALDAASRTLFVAHYGSGQVAALPLAADGAPRAPVSVMQNAGTGPTSRQTSPHAHAVVLDPTGRYLLSADLGADRVFVYRLDPATHRLAPAATPFVQLPPGSGPRHIAFAPDGRSAYLVTELTAEVVVLRWNARAGTLAAIQTLPLDAPDYRGTKSGAEIVASRDGRHLYASNRGDDTIETFAIDPHTGTLKAVQHIPSGGTTPRSFALAPDGRWVVVANQGSDAVTVLPRDTRTGRLSPPVTSIATPSPVTIAFAGQARRCS